MSGVITAGDVEAEFAGVSIDTRTLVAGELFVGIHGERFDGADFAKQAVASGAAGGVVPHGRGPERGGGPPFVVIEVADTTAALQALARAVRRDSGTKVVAITGSAGKTTTKEVTSELLSARYRVARNQGNLNNHIGLPLSLLELRHRPEIAVVELGMNHAGEIRTLVGIAEPEVRVWTNVGEAHLGFFGSLDAIAEAKAEILEGATPSTLFVANADDARVVRFLPGASIHGGRRYAGRTVTFGIDRQADVQARSMVDRGIDGIRAHVVTPKGEIDIETPLIGRANLANLLAATAVALEFDVPLTSIAERAGTLRAAPHRGEIVRLAGGVTVIDDSYNANPTATLRALDVLASATPKRRVAVLGEMLELGSDAVRLHEEVGRAAVRAGVDLLVTVGGPPAAALAEAAVAGGLPRSRVRHASKSDEAADILTALIEAGDLVLVKGSRGVRTDRVVERLKAGRG